MIERVKTSMITRSLEKVGGELGKHGGIFQAGETSLYDTMIHDTRYLLKPTELYDTTLMCANI